MATSTTTTTTSPAPATAKIKLFQFIQTHYQTTGMYSPSQADQNHSLNKNVWLIFLCFVQFEFTLVTFLLFKAESIGEMIISYLVSITFAFYVIVIPVSTLKIPKVLQLIEKFDEFIRKSKYSKNNCHFSCTYIIVFFSSVRI